MSSVWVVRSWRRSAARMTEDRTLALVEWMPATRTGTTARFRELERTWQVAGKPAGTGGPQAAIKMSTDMHIGLSARSAGGESVIRLGGIVGKSAIFSGPGGSHNLAGLPGSLQRIDSPAKLSNDERVTAILR